MNEAELRKLTDAVETGLRDGRSLESLRRAMMESGYSEEDVRRVVGNIDRRKIIRREERRIDTRWVAMGVIVLLLLGGWAWFSGSEHKEARVAEQPSMHGGETNVTGKRICYASNESVKRIMIEAGTKCDEWYIIMKSSPDE